MNIHQKNKFEYLILISIKLKSNSNFKNPRRDANERHDARGISYRKQCCQLSQIKNISSPNTEE